MPLPTDNETEGVIITAAPPPNADFRTAVVQGELGRLAMGSPAAASPVASASRFMPFRKTLRGRWSWYTCAATLLIFVLAYQLFPNYFVSFDDGVIPSYTNAQMRLGAGWQTPPQRTPDQSYILGLRTTATGSIYLPNFGYAIGTGAYDLQVEAGATRPISFTVSVGNQLIGTYAVQNQGIKPSISIPASAFLAAGPHPSIIFAITRYAPASAASAAPTLILGYFNLNAPSAFVIVIPPALILLNIALIALLYYLVMRKRYPLPQAGSRAMTAPVLAFVVTLYVWVKPAVRLDIPVQMHWVTILVALITLIAWRRELANWLLHLRYPADERFIVR